jgi:hypothetical protein
MHVSSHGMLLHCEPDGRPRTFSNGDSVDIHLTVQHNGEQKKLTIPSHVRHAAENSLDVEFHHPDPVLLDLIESYRTSDTHKLEATIGDVHTGDAQPEVIPIPGSQLSGKGTRDALASPDSAPRGNRRKHLGLIVLLGLACVLAVVYFYTSGLHHRVSTLETLADRRANELADMQNKLFSASLLEGKYASLDARISALGNAIATIERRVHMQIAGTTTTAPEQTQQQEEPPPAIAAISPPSSSPENTGAASGSIVRPAEATKQTIASGSLATRTTRQQALPDSRPAKAAEDVTQEDATDEVAMTAKPATTDTLALATKAPGGPWVINLLSSRDKQDLVHITRQAQSHGIQTELNNARVKGKNYWRLQVPGFNTLAEAKTRAEEIKQTLGLNDVWFLKRKPGSRAHTPDT